MTNETLLIRRSEILEILDWNRTIQAVRDAFLASANNSVLPPASTQVTMAAHSLHIKAGGLIDPPVVTLKANLRPDAAAALGAVLVFDQRANRLRAVLDSSDITALRTAATAALGVQALAGTSRPRIAVLGAGPIGLRILAALLALTDVAHIDLWSYRGVGIPEALEFLKPDMSVTVHETPGLATKNADVVISCTPSRTPLITAADLKEGVAVIALGADSPGKRELASDVLEGSLLLVDVRAGATAVGETSYLGAGAEKAIWAEFGQLLAGQVTLPAVRPVRVVFDSVGSSFVDAAVSAVVVDEAERRGLGTPFNFAS
jgi:ornithine cyclodeaminase/alanine dehydrogenase-like protein (mu-crystallin family)